MDDHGNDELDARDELAKIARKASEQLTLEGRADTPQLDALKRWLDTYPD